MLEGTAAISANTFIEIAKNTLKPMKCDWDAKSGCTAILSSWNSLQQHYHKAHCCSSRMEGTQEFLCGLPRCTGRSHSSITALESHINMSHMSRVSLSCPLEACTQDSFLRPRDLSEHLRSSHAELINQTTISETLRQSCQPFFSPSFPSPPALPVKLIPVSTILAPPIITSRHPNGSVPTSTPSLKRKWTKLHGPDLHGDEKTNSPSDTLVFDDLDSFSSEIGECHDIIIRRTISGVRACQTLISRPLPMADPPNPDTRPPVSIHYHAFAARVEGIVEDSVAKSA